MSSIINMIFAFIYVALTFAVFYSLYTWWDKEAENTSEISKYIMGTMVSFFVSVVVYYYYISSGGSVKILNWVFLALVVTTAALVEVSREKGSKSPFDAITFNSTQYNNMVFWLNISSAFAGGIVFYTGQ